MTIREEFKKALDLVDTEDGRALPLSVMYCFRTIANILYVDALKRNRRKPDKKVMETLGTCINQHSIWQGLQLSGFLTWWLDQEAIQEEYDDDGNVTRGSWWDTSEIVNSWNKYASDENERRQNASL